MNTPILIKLDFEEDDLFSGVDAVALVNQPAIEVDFFAFNKFNFATYSDYPKAVSAAAERGIRLNEAVNNKCATQVGKIRAQQLAQGKPISEETIKRMFAYLSRAKAYYNPDDTEACGTISYLLWGGEPALGWSERKLAQIEREREMKAENEVIDSSYSFAKSNDVYLISCSSEKLNKKSLACELYDSALFKKSLKYSRKKVKDDYIKILSAKYHLVDLDQMIEPYDLTLKTMPAEARQQWADKVYEMLNEKFSINNDQFIFMAGNSYTEYLIPKFKYSKDLLKGKKIGERLEYLDKFYVCFNSDTIAFKYLLDDIEQLPDEESKNVLDLFNRISLNIQEETFCDVVSECESKAQYSTNFSIVEEDEQMIVSPVMIPNKPILRKGVDGEYFYVYFTPDTIQRMAHTFLKNKYTDKFNIEHDGGVKLDGVYVVESWVKADDKDKSYKYNFNLPDGTWFVQLKVEDTNLWKMIKNGTVKGLSLEGIFNKMTKVNQTDSFVEVTTEGGTKLFIKEESLVVFILDDKGEITTVAPDGEYTLNDGSKLVVKNGKANRFPD